MSLEVVPELLDGTEFGRVAGEALEVKPAECVAHRIDGRSLVDLSAIPEQEGVSAEMLEQQAQDLATCTALKLSC